MARVPLGRYAKMRGVNEQVIRYQVETGKITRDRDGTISVEEADSTWYAMHQARSSQRVDGTPADSRLIRARLASTVAKSQLARHNMDKIRVSVVNRAESIKEAKSELDTLLGDLNEPEFSILVELGLSIDEAESLMDDFMRKAMVELGDIVAEVDRD